MARSDNSGYYWSFGAATGNGVAARMTVLRRTLFLLWMLFGLLWLAFVVEVFHYQGEPNSNTSVAGIFLLPPTILFLAGLGLTLIWERFGQAHWLRLPENLRRGIARLYLVVTVPWVAWYIYQIFDAGSHYDFEDEELYHAFWSLLIVPIGGPTLFAIIVWIVIGFQGTEARNKETKHIQTSEQIPKAPQAATPPNAPQNHRPTTIPSSVRLLASCRPTIAQLDESCMSAPERSFIIKRADRTAGIEQRNGARWRMLFVRLRQKVEKLNLDRRASLESCSSCRDFG